jgi:hypothetical protein
MIIRRAEINDIDNILPLEEQIFIQKKDLIGLMKKKDHLVMIY